MDDFPLLILFFMIYLLAGFAGKKNKKPRRQDRRGPMRKRAQGEQMNMRANTQDKQTKEGFQTAFSSDNTMPCDQSRMHLHEVSVDEFMDASEGEDPCHVGGIKTDEEDRAEQPDEDEAQRAFRQSLLNGVIMSEILMRPDERRAMQRSRRRTNG